jgi:triphosphatase
MQTEIEYCLCLPTEQQKAFAMHVTQLFPQASSSHTQDLLSIYYDTPELHLARQGLGLRLRRQGDTWVQTVKFVPATTSSSSLDNDAEASSRGLHTRVEIEHVTATQALELQHIEHAPMRDFLTSASIAPVLQPVFTTRIQRTQWHIPCPKNGMAELALDIGTIECNTHTMPVSEVEIELKQGALEALLPIVQTLQQELALSPQPYNKAERGYRLMLQTLGTSAQHGAA